jgi:hypothetical protein
MKRLALYGIAFTAGAVGIAATAKLYSSAASHYGAGHLHSGAHPAALAGRAGHSSVAGPEAPVVELDFELVGGRMLVPVQIDGHAARAVLDTGAGASLVDLRLAEDWRLAFSHGQVEARGIGGQPVQGRILRGAVVAFGGISEPLPYAIPLLSLAESAGDRFEVIIGYPFFASHCVEVDYGSRRLRILAPGADLGGSGTSVAVRFVRNLPHIEAQVTIGGLTHAVEAMVDTGASDSGVTGRFLAAHPLAVETTPRVLLAGGVGGDSEGRWFRAEGVEIGGVTLARPVLSATETAGGVKGSQATYDLSIGADLLRRFRVTFDYPRARLLLAPGADVEQPFEADKTGLRLHAQGEALRSFRVAGVLAGSAAADAGVEVGDVLETVDGAPASRFTLAELREVFRSARAAGWQLGIRRGERRLEVELTARSVI